MLRVVSGLPMDGRGERLLEEARARGPASGHLHVVRTGARAEQLREVEAAPGGCRVGTAVARLSDLVRALAGKRTHPRPALGEGTRAILLDELARAEARAPLISVPGLAAWLGRLFSRLKQGDVFSPERAFERFRSLDRDDPGTQEALRLFGLYQTRLVELGLYDDDGLYLEVARDLGTAELPFDRVQQLRRRLVVEGFYQTNVVERAVFEKLFAAFDETLWLVDAPESAGAGFGLSVLEDLNVGRTRVPGDRTWLARTAGFEPAGVPDDAETGATSDTQLQLPFASESLNDQCRLEAGGPGGPFDWFWSAEIAARTRVALAPDERGEASFLAERAAALLRDDPAASVVIAFPSDRAATALLQEACADVGLALAVAPGRTLADCVAARAFLSLLSLAARDFPRELVVSALRVAPDGVVLGGNRLVAARVDKIARRAGIVGGKEAWKRRLDRHARALEEEAAAATDEADRDFRRRDAADADAVRRGVEALAELLPAAAPSTAAAFSESARDLLERFGFLHQDRIPAEPSRPEEIEAFATAARTRAALEAALAEYAASANLLAQGERLWSEHVAALGVLFAATPVPSPPPLRRGARLVGLRELRGLVTDHLLVGGLTEDALPGPAPKVPLLDEADAALAGARTAEARRREAEHLLLQALGSPRRSLVLSRPATVDGCEALPALALEAVREKLGGADIDAGRELREGAVLGRTARARQVAAALADPAALAEAGADLPLAWHRLGAERERRDPARLGRFEGMLEAAALPLLRPEADAIRISASAFEKYAGCPLKTFYGRVLGLRPPDEPGREISPRDGGTLVHEILHAFHVRVAAGGVRSEDRPRVLEAIARERLARLPFDGLFAEVYRDGLTRDLLRDGPSRRPGLLRTYLDAEAKRKDGFEPAFFEASFGPPRGFGRARTNLMPDPIGLFDVEIGGRRVAVGLEGSIDRIDVREEGGTLLALVLDYKTGSIEGKSKEAKTGRAFQLPLYAFVLPRLLAPHARGRAVRPIAAAYYQVKGPSEIGIKAPLAGEAALEMLRNRSKPLPGGLEKLVADYVERARDVVAAHYAGRFHPTAIAHTAGGQSVCDECDFQFVCRGRDEASRIGRMPAAAGRFPQAVDLVGDADEPEAES